MQLSRVFITCFAPFLALTLNAQPKWVDVIEYKQIEDGENLSLHIAYPEGHTPADKRPAVIYFFGGGWKRGKPGQFYPYIKDLSSKGIVGISAQYRTKTSHDASPTDGVKDGKSAVRYVREHAAEMGIDPDKIIVGGGSAGGHIAACTAIAGAPEEGDENPAVSSRPQALILLNPVIDVGPNGYAHGYVKPYIDDWTRISPLQSVDKDFPPTLIQVGTNDNVLPVDKTEAFNQAMLAQGNACEIVYYDGATHGFFNKPEYLPKTIEKIDAFLAAQGYMPAAQ